MRPSRLPFRHFGVTEQIIAVNEWFVKAKSATFGLFYVLARLSSGEERRERREK